MKPVREKPGPDQESVWDYPRPPRLEPVPERIRIEFNGETVADTLGAFRVLETSHPPVYYLPPDNLNQSFLRPSTRRSFCEWKGTAAYLSLKVGDRELLDVGWYYHSPSPGFEAIRDHVAFYAEPMDLCRVGDEIVRPQPGGFYGGWVTSLVVGPFKGEPGTEFW